MPREAAIAMRERVAKENRAELVLERTVWTKRVAPRITAPLRCTREKSQLLNVRAFARDFFLRFALLGDGFQRKTDPTALGCNALFSPNDQHVSSAEPWRLHSCKQKLSVQCCHCVRVLDYGVRDTS